MLVALLGAVGCTGPQADTTAPPPPPTWQEVDDDTSSPTSPKTPTTTTTTTTTTPPPALFGEVPAVPLAAPEFTATAMTGETRSQADLIGVPTVMWFYPAAFTGG